MKAFLVFSSLLVLSASLPDDPDTRAASPIVNCGCQCDPYTWQDDYGYIQGNCKSKDKTGGLWCYTYSRTCQDLQYSKNRIDNYGKKRAWSYQACSTPAINSYECSGGGGGGGGGHHHGGGGGSGGYNPGNGGYNPGSGGGSSHGGGSGSGYNPGSGGGGGYSEGGGTPGNINLITLLGARNAGGDAGGNEDESVSFDH